MGVSVKELIAEGKTKKIWSVHESESDVIVESKDDLTAGDGAKHHVIAGKARLSNRTTSNVFRLLQSCGLPVAFKQEISETGFLAERCAMIPYEVVVRREAHGSFLKRYPGVKRGHFFPRLIVEFFLKTSGKKWKDVMLPKDDPLIRFDGNCALLYLPDHPIYQQNPFLTLKDFPLRDSESDRKKIGSIAVKTFLILEKAWQIRGMRLVDFKVEFGKNTNAKMRLADVIDNDSWRVLENGNYIDKQVYRDGADINTVSEKYRLVADLTGSFGLPRQQIILWRASTHDDLYPFADAIAAYGVDEDCQVKFSTYTCSLHKEPVLACQEIWKLTQEIPDSVVIVYAGRSNGAGPTLSAQVTVPVITVPANFKDFPDDVWSSLRTPSEAPAATILDPKNAVLSALQILAIRNPRLYAELRVRQERRLSNIINI